MLNCLAVGLGGFLGSVCRYLAGFIPINKGGSFPVNTLLINIIGAFVLSLVASIASKGGSLSPRAVLFLKVGLCGGFTTFSTFAYEASGLLSGGHPALGILYICLSAVLGVLAILAGQFLIG